MMVFGSKRYGGDWVGIELSDIKEMKLANSLKILAVWNREILFYL